MCKEPIQIIIVNDKRCNEDDEKNQPNDSYQVALVTKLPVQLIKKASSRTKEKN
jgi:hypothetical protein